MKKIIQALLVTSLFLFGTAQAATGAIPATPNQLSQAEAKLPGGETASDLMTPNEGDLSMMVIRKVLGGDIATSSGTLPIIGDAMLVFNIIMLAIGSFIFTGVAVSGILRTGADGEALGKKWSSSMVPLRFGAATALLIPTASGFSLGQVMTMAAVAMGVGAGDSVWRAASTNAVTRMSELSAFTVQSTKEDTDMAKTILKNELCLLNYQRHTQAQADMQRVSSPIETAHQVDATGALYWSIVEKPFNASATPRMLMSDDPMRAAIMPMGGNTQLYKGICGRSEAFGAVQTAKANTAITTLNASQEIDAMIETTNRTIDRARYAGVLAASGQLKRYAEKVAATYNTYEIPLDGSEPAGTLPTLGFTSKNATITENGTKETIEQAVQLYKQQLATAITNKPISTQFNKKMIADANESGWVNSGIWFYQFAKISSGIKGKLNSPSTIYGPMPTNLSQGNPPLESVSAANKSVENVGESGWATSLTLSPSEVVNFAAGKFYSSLGANDPKNMKSWFGYDPNSADHPLIQLQQSGLAMMDIGIAAKIGLQVGEFTIDVASKNIAAKTINMVSGVVDAVVNLLKSVINQLNYAAMALIVFGAMKAFLIPLLPFIKILKAVVMFFITVCEVLVATPLWIAFHMTPDGDGFASDRVQGGYGIILEAALRPMLIVFGLLFAFLLMWPLMSLMSAGFEVVTNTISQGVGIQNSVGAYVHKLIALFAYLLLFVMLSYIIIDKCCDVIDILPTQIMKWVGIQAGASNSTIDREFAGGAAAAAKPGPMAGPGAGAGLRPGKGKGKKEEKIDAAE
jgi:conjugal transfer/type IV secretion protein DotA/TraY